MSVKEDEEFVLMKEIYRELRDDAFGVATDLLEGIDAIAAASIFAFATTITLLFTSYMSYIATQTNYVIFGVYCILAVIFFAAGLFAWNKYSRLKIRYSTLIEIKKTLKEGEI